MRENIIPANFDIGERGEASWLDRVARRGMLRLLAGLRHGIVEVEDEGSVRRYGGHTAECDLTVRLTVRDPRFYTEVAFGGNTGAGEAYIRGYWDCDDLTGLIRIMVVNRDTLLAMETGAARLLAPVKKAAHWLHRNTRDGSRRNIAAHYDLGNELFERFLDPTMMYSSAIFPSEDATLEEASVAKLDAICRKLELGPDDHLLEIGTGWGGLATHAAVYYGCRVTTTTISREQYAAAEERVAAAGVADRVTLLLEDYRDLTGQYDKLVSVEMIEAVGHQFLDTYLAKCSSLLKPDGMMLLQAITIADQHYAKALRTVDFIKKFIFPGSFIPSVTAIVSSLTRSTDMRVFHLQDIGPHYATTLRRWREAFLERQVEIRSFGYPHEFVRMWEYYLCYCEGGFMERNIGDVQMLLTKPGCRRDSLAY